jgi:hypothetical protein
MPRAKSFHPDYFSPQKVIGEHNVLISATPKIPLL